MEIGNAEMGRVESDLAVNRVQTLSVLYND